MLAQLLEAAGVPSMALPIRRVDEILATVAAENPDVVLISGLPPFGMARAHRLYRSLRVRNPDVRVIIGIWGYADDVGKAGQKISRGDPVHISTTLADAVDQVRSLVGASTPQVAVEEPSPANAA
jgi:methylmalonyl-CoA mutase cobalamin-binding subunit